MSSAHPIRPRMVTKNASTYAIVASQYNTDYVQGLVNHAHQELSELEPDCTIKLHLTPGAFEIPLLVKLAADQKRYTAILALGVILQGETAHATLIGQTVTAALMDIALESATPIIHEVLLLDNEEQAKVRCLETEHNRGTEAARAAIAIARAIREMGGAKV